MTDTTHAKEAIATELGTLTETLKGLGILNPAVPSDWITITKSTHEADQNDVADQHETYLTDRASLAELEARYNNLTLALGKIENDTYGTCEVCTEVIESDRLAANPAARTCKTHIEVIL